MRTAAAGARAPLAAAPPQGSASCCLPNAATATAVATAAIRTARSGVPDSPALHKYLLAYASDFSFIGTALQPHGVSSWSKFIQLASLDHAIWFHREVKLDDWLLYSIDSPWAGNARGFARGSIFNRQGQLVASVAQEGLTRVREDWK